MILLRTNLIVATALLHFLLIFLLAVPSIQVMSFPASVNIINVCPYNQFSLNCTARAYFEEAAVYLTVSMDWIQRRSRSDTLAFSDVMLFL